jgi:benzoyl-CoA 2,3-dioxygenase component B
MPYAPNGDWVGDDEWARMAPQWLPTTEDEEYIESLMQPVLEPGKIAGWIAAPKHGINHKGFDHEYVKFSDDPYVRT